MNILEALQFRECRVFQAIGDLRWGFPCGVQIGGKNAMKVELDEDEAVIIRTAHMLHHLMGHVIPDGAYSLYAPTKWNGEKWVVQDAWCQNCLVPEKMYEVVRDSMEA